ncbi:MAG: hypothetical protein JWM91_121 [Rhodospirillales bacterium]|nr:hypothetical protein [Rhodospirillales bacterium]
MTVSRRTLRTFDNQSGRNVFYRAAIHPLTAPLTARLIEKVAGARSVAIYDPRGYFADLAAMHDLSGWSIEGIYVQRLEEVGQDRAGFPARPLSEFLYSAASMIFVADFDSERLLSRLGPYRPAVAEVESFDALRLGPEFLTDPGNYLEPLNFVSDFLFFRDADGLHTSVSTINYWYDRGARDTRLWCRLFGADGAVLADWEQKLLPGPSGIRLDSAKVRQTFGLGEFTGSLFVHVIGPAAHDTLKYAVDIYDDAGATTTATHDSNPWPADFYAGLPAAVPGQSVRLWIQNCYPTPIPPGATHIRPMGAPDFVGAGPEIPPYGTMAIDAADYFPGVAWPAQFEIRADKYCCRPRYEIDMGDGHRSVAHVNVERGDLKAAADLPEASRILGKGFILPGPLLPLADWSGIVLPTPMATWQNEIALMLRAYDSDGALVAEHALGKRARDAQTSVALDDILPPSKTLAGGYGHLELCYDFAAGTQGDGWLHAIFRFARRDTGRSAETSFGSHLFNVPAVWRNEPSAYLGKPPGLSTRLFLRLPDQAGRTMCHLSFPTSGRWRALSETDLILHSAAGDELVRKRIAIPCSGSRLIDVAATFDAADLKQAAGGGYVLIRDTTCRLFGYHIFLGWGGGFALDHMFGF